MNEIRYLVLIRHATTDWNLTGRLNSFTDLTLNSRGMSEANRLSEYIKIAFPGANIWSSPLKRAQETAAKISDLQKQKFQIISTAQEINFGRFEGETPEDIASGPDASQYISWEKGRTVENVESFADAAVRADNVYQHIMQSNTSQYNLLITHGAFLRILICVKALNISPTFYRKLVVDNASVSVLQIPNQSARLLQLNNTSFLVP